MANLTIYQPEILFLRTQILTCYCKAIGYDFDTYCQHLTGTLKHYEHICEVMQDEVGKQEKVLKYLGMIRNKILKNSLEKQLGYTESEQRRFLKEQASCLSANVLRKLIFEGTREASQGYKKSFIQTCYLYIEKERSEFPQQQPILKDTLIGTIPLFEHGQDPMVSVASTTIPVLKTTPSFSLTPLKADEDIIIEDKDILSFKGENIRLNRNNLDKNNLTITSKIQAEIRLENGEWVLINESKLRTTFIQVNSSVKIKKGDIIVFGNQRFLFDE